MRALIATGPANAATPLELREVEEPSPAPDESVVAVRAVSINRGELRLLSVRRRGWRPGQDIGGTVVTAAADGGGPAVGSRVVGLVDQAGWSERVAAPHSRVAVLPDGVSFAQAATLPVAGLTALRALRLGGTLLGRTVLVTGASGGVGHLAVQLAARPGTQVAGISQQSGARQVAVASRRRPDCERHRHASGNSVVRWRAMSRLKGWSSASWFTLDPWNGAQR
jgi:NADPH:quinone reductase